MLGFNLGDQIVSVDGVYVKDKPHKDAVKILRDSGQRVRLEVEKGNLKTEGEISFNCF